jgi:hypothetical protein
MQPADTAGGAWFNPPRALQKSIQRFLNCSLIELRVSRGPNSILRVILSDHFVSLRRVLKKLGGCFVKFSLNNFGFHGPGSESGREMHDCAIRFSELAGCTETVTLHVAISVSHTLSCLYRLHEFTAVFPGNSAVENTNQIFVTRHA